MISQCQGGGQPNISQGIIKNMDVIDAPIEEQIRFAAFVEQSDKSKFEIQQSLEKLETLKKALMQKYFG
jgi:type I restriction enzyme S subunit